MATCSGQARGSLSTVVIDFEDQATYGADPSTTAGIQVPFISESVSATRNQIKNEVINGTRNPTAPVAGNNDVTGDIVVPVDVRSFPYWMKALLGAPTTTGAGPYTHVFKVEDTLCQPSMVYEKFITDIPRAFKYNGVKVASMSMSLGDDGSPQATFSLVGASDGDSATAYDASPTSQTLEIFKPALDVVLNEGGSATTEFTDLSIDISANLDTDVFGIGNSGNRSALPDGVYDIGGSGTLLFDNMTMYDKADAATESSIELVYTRGAHSLTIDFNEVEYAKTSPVVEGPEGVSLNLDWTAFDTDDAANSAIVVTVVNDAASYA